MAGASHDCFWSPYVRGELRVERAAGNHLTMFDPVDAPSLGARPGSNQNWNRWRVSDARWARFRPPFDCHAVIVLPRRWRRRSLVTADGEGRRMVNETHDSAAAIMTTRSSAVDVIVVGGGQAGISLSYYLQQEGVSHVVSSETAHFSSWYRRWEGFHANTPAWMNTLPVLPEALPGGDPDGFARGN